MDDPATLTATQARAQIAAGKLSPAALMEACLDRIAARDPEVRAMAFLDPALAQQGAAHAAPGLLHGLPVGVKDVLDTADLPSEYNSPIWRGHRPRADAAAVAWTRAAGGVVIGKTVTTEFATRRPGPTANPHNVQHTPGGLLRRRGLQAELRHDQPFRHEGDVRQPGHGGRHGPQRRGLRVVRRRRQRA